MTGARNSAGSAQRHPRHQRLCRRTELRGIQTGVIRIDISDAILDETIRVLRDKFGWDGYRLHDARLRMANFTNRVTPAQTLDVIKEDPPDNRILECAVEAGSDYIVTWDKDLLRLRRYGK